MNMKNIIKTIKFESLLQRVILSFIHKFTFYSKIKKIIQHKWVIQIQLENIKKKKKERN